MRETEIAKGEYYHIYNRGVDHRSIIQDAYDTNRFIQSLIEFNVEEPIGSIYENSFKTKKLQVKNNKNKKLVDIVCYCLNPNHFHFLLMPHSDDGIAKFMHRLSMGYARYFNQKYHRSGALFQGKFKAKHVSNNDYLLHLSAYVNLNNRVHQLGHRVTKLVRTSWPYYTGERNNDLILSGTDIVTDQFKNHKEYIDFSEDALISMLETKEEDREEELNDLFIDN